MKKIALITVFSLLLVSIFGSALDVQASYQSQHLSAEGDTIPPQLTIWDPSDNYNLSVSSVIVHGEAYDENGIQKVTVNGEAAKGYSTPTSFYWQRTIDLTEGVNTITVVAYDNSPNNNAATKNITVIYQVSGYLGPTITLQPVTNLTANTATISCIINPNGLDTSIYLWYSESSWENAPFVRGQSLGWYSGTEGIVISYDFTSLPKGESISYRFNVSNSQGQAYTKVATFTTLTTLPNAPTDLKATIVSGNQVDLTWTDNSDDEAGFSIERKPEGEGYGQIAEAGANVVLYSDIELDSTNYYYRVRAYNDYGNSVYSNEALATAHSAFSAYDYFPSGSGHYIVYTMSDEYNNLDNCEVEVVFQYCEEGNFFTTLTQLGTSGGYFCNSAIFGEEYEKFHYCAGCPVGNQANFWFSLFTLPLTFGDGDTWQYLYAEETNPTVYQVRWVGDVEVVSETYEDCVKIQIDNTNSLEPYVNGQGEIYLSPGIGIIKYEFRRSGGKVFTAEIVESGELPPRTISGRLTLDGEEPAEGYMVGLANRGKEGINADITDSQGRFSLQAFGHSIVLRYGPLLNEEKLDPSKSRTYKIEDIAGDISGLELSIRLPPYPVFESEDLLDETSLEIHKKAWHNVADKASSNPDYKYAIYQSRTIAVKHPEVYLQADSLFDGILTTEDNMWDYYMERTQNLEEQGARYEEIWNSQGEKFEWSKFDIGRHKEVGYQEVYDSEGFFPFLDMRLHFLGSALKGTDWQATPLSMAEFLYFKYQDRNPYLLMNESGTAYLSLTSSPESELLRYDGQEVESPDGKVVLIFNDESVWYPLMGRDDTNGDDRLNELVQEYSSGENIPDLTEDEEELIEILENNTEFTSEEDGLWALAFAGKLHARSWPYFPEIFRELYPQAAEEGGFNLSHGPTRMTSKNAFVARVSNYLCPATAKLARIARENPDLRLDAIVARTLSWYLDYVETSQNPRQGNLELWFHSELNYLNMDDSFLSKASNCIYSATNTASIFDLTAIENMETYVTGFKYVNRGGGHAYTTTVFGDRAYGFIENIIWRCEEVYNGFSLETGAEPALDQIISRDGWVTFTEPVYFDGDVIRTSFGEDELMALLCRVEALAPEAKIARYIEGYSIVRIPIGEFIASLVQAKVSILPETQEASPGGSFTIDVVVGAGDYDLIGISIGVEHNTTVMTTSKGQIVGHNLLGDLQIGPTVTDGTVTYGLVNVTPQANVSGSVLTIEFTVDADAEPGDYDITLATATLLEPPVPGVDLYVEVTDGTVTVVLGRKGDFTGDGDIDIYDFVLFAAAYGSELGDDNYNPIGDFDNNHRIDIYDFVRFAAVYGT